MLKQPPKTPLSELTAILLARLGVLWLLVIISLLIPRDDAAFHSFMGIAFIITIPYSLWLRNKLRTAQFAPLQFLVDLIIVTGLVYYTGGVHSSLTLLYPLVILSAGIIGTPRQATETTVLAIITYTLMATLLSNHILIEYRPTHILQGNPVSGIAVFLRGLMFAFFGGASIYISKRCQYTNDQQKQLSSTTVTLLEGIPVPALLLNEQGNILFANAPALNMLETDAEPRPNTRFTELCTNEGPPIPEHHGKTTYLQRANSPPIAVSYKSFDFQLLETALFGSNARKNAKMPVTLVALHDITPFLKTENRQGKFERLAAATRITGEMADEIRTPLTSLSASIQLLRNYEENTTPADWLPNSPRRRDRLELFDHIEEASQRMDTVITNFVNFAQFSPTDLLSIIKLDSPGKN